MSTALDRCRVCASPFFETPLLVQKNMPAAAQYFPDEAGLKTDKGIDLVLCQCQGCGLVQLSNEPVPYHREVIRAAGFSPEMQAFRTQQFQAFVDRFKLKNKKVIEMGCGRGEYLSLMKACGTIASGIEFSESAVESCQNNGLDVRKDYIEDSTQRLIDGPYDAFFIMSFLEHMPRINAALQGIANNLSSGAVGMVEVPNFDMILKNDLFSEFITDHLFYFTQASLTSLLQNNGFEVLECNVVWHDYIISAVVKKRSPLNLEHFKYKEQQIKKTFDDFLAQFPANTVATWGAGHQALAIMAMAELGGRVKYVVDSAPFKQGKYTHATHIPIVDPSQLKKDPVRAVMVMAASYSDEVVRTIRREYGNDLSLAVLRDAGLEVL